jgi:TonB-dependent receptor
MAKKLRYNLPATLVWSCLIFSVLMMVPNEVLAQSGRITGKVIDVTTREALPGASILVKGTTIGAATDRDGNYTIQGAPAGNDTLVISYIGYKSQSKPVTVIAGKEVKVDFDLRSLSVVGQEVVVSVQATGQKQAINQQLASNTIENVVSESRIRSLPDVNAAESIGRLPGVSIQRSGGEAQKVAVRGLSPKYNLVTVNGVQVPATGETDRSVNLSIISSNMLDGISLKKVVTPDMDADVLGGTIDLKLKQAPDSLMAIASYQSGYNRLKTFYGNYQVEASISNRFFHHRLGIIANFSINQYNRSANIYNGGYNLGTATGTNEKILKLNNVTLNEQNVIRGRTGGSAVIDYKLPNGSITFNAFYNRLRNNSLTHTNDFQNILSTTSNPTQILTLALDPKNTSSIFTSALGFQKDFNWIQVDATVSKSSTVGKDPSNYSWQFDDEYASSIFSSYDSVTTATTPSTLVSRLALNDTSAFRLRNLFLNTTHRNEFVTGAQLNLKFPFHIGDQISGYFKTGGKLRWLDRMNNQEQVGRDGLQYGGGGAVADAIDIVDPSLNLRALTLQYGYIPMTPFAVEYMRPGFLSGSYGDTPLSFVPSLPLMRRLWNALVASDTVGTGGSYARYFIPSAGSDYTGKERKQAAYIMAEIDLGPHIVFLPGVRYEYNYTHYNGVRFVDVNTNTNPNSVPKGLDSLSIVRHNSYWLPMFQMKIKPTDWLSVRLARTETLARPDFTQYTPITTMNSGHNYLRAANSLLKPAKSTNYDAALSIFDNHIGLFTADVFYKKVENLIFQTSYLLVGDKIQPLPGMNIPPDWLTQITGLVTADTYLNNPNPTTYKGFELDWQTNFWYLPSFLKGLVLDVNFSRIYSHTTIPVYKAVTTYDYHFRPPRTEFSVVDTIRTARMPDQPKYITNITLGYDFHGFSIRVSYLYQTDVVTYINDLHPVLDNYTGAYTRWDAAIKQNLPMGLQVFLNLNNLNNRRDHSYQGDINHPVYTQNYGFTADLGVRYQF